jgi:hypothetical protein
VQNWSEGFKKRGQGCHLCVTVIPVTALCRRLILSIHFPKGNEAQSDGFFLSWAGSSLAAIFISFSYWQ